MEGVAAHDGITEVVFGYVLQSCTSFTLPCMGRIAQTAAMFHELIEQACKTRIRELNATFFASQSDFLPLRSLRRVTLWQAFANQRIVTTEGYSSAIDKLGNLFVWGQPGWRMGSKSADAAHLLPPVRARYSNARGSVNFKSVVATRHAIFVLSNDGMIMFATSTPGSGIELRPLKELEETQVAQIASRFGQVFAVTSYGSVYAWGLVRGAPTIQEHEECSMGFGKNEDQLVPLLIPRFDGINTKIRFVTCGLSHSVFVSEAGEAFAVGRNDHGKLGVGSSDMNFQALVPIKAEFESMPDVPFIVGAAVGAFHTLLLSASGRVWGCGDGSRGVLPMPSAPSSRSEQNGRLVERDRKAFGLRVSYACWFAAGRSDWPHNPFFPSFQQRQT